MVAETERRYKDKGKASGSCGSWPVCAFEWDMKYRCTRRGGERGVGEFVRGWFQFGTKHAVAGAANWWRMPHLSWVLLLWTGDCSPGRLWPLALRDCVAKWVRSSVILSESYTYVRGETNAFTYPLCNRMVAHMFTQLQDNGKYLHAGQWRLSNVTQLLLWQSRLPRKKKKSWRSETDVRVYARCVDPSVLAFSLSWPVYQSLLLSWTTYNNQLCSVHVELHRCSYSL